MNAYLVFIRRLLQLLFATVPPLAVRAAFRLFCYPAFDKIRNREQAIRSRAEIRAENVGGKTIKLFRWGSGNKTALLVHGWEGNAGSLGGFVEPLTNNGFRVISFDGPAHGESSGYFTNLVEFSGVVGDLMKRVGPIDAVISHSFGSGAAVLALHRNPEIQLRNLVMVTAPDELKHVIREFSELMHLTDQQHQRLVRFISKRFGVPARELVLHKMIPEIRVDRVMLLHDPEDRVLPFSGARRIAEASNKLQLVKAENRGHYRILWDSDLIRTVTGFVNTSNEKSTA
ncbi:MAG: alpha/beta hydrolase [Balneolaceae bacterium]|nr:alpha/beta hydrolase [Balneolaceae bacterium]